MPHKNSRLHALALPVFLLLLWISPRPAAAQITPEQEKQLFSRVDEVFRQVSDIMGLKIRHAVPRAVITREKIRDYINQRMKEVLPPEEIHAQEVVLKKFGFVGSDFDLKSQTLDLLTEQAAAFYDFKQKKLYLASWTPESMQDIALVHELSHALADQHFKLEKFIDKSGNDDDAATARGAVVEGQASWVMTEYMLRQAGQSLKDSPNLADSTANLTAEGAKEFPVFGASPLYLQVTMMFPYTEGMLFQQAVYQKLGVEAFAEVFRHPPVSSQQIIHPGQYFAHTLPAKPALPSAALPSGYKKLMEGTLGELDFQVLLQQFISQQEAGHLAPRWRGSRYALWENKKDKRDVLGYSVQWADEADAARYFADYKKAAAKKWKQLRFDSDHARAAAGSGDDGHFEWRLDGPIFTSVEGLP